MDKSNRNKTITIKINGNEESYIKEQNKEKASNKKGKEDISPLVIESAASKETSDESFEWVIPSNEVKAFEKESLFVSNNEKKKNNRNERMFQKLFISIVMAVLIGAGFWYIVFQTITAREAPAVNTSAPLGETDVGGGQASAANVVPIELFFVQGGVFSNREAAMAAKDEFSAKGFPAIVVGDGDKSYVALFASDSLENAKAVGKTYKDQGIDVYWKEMVVSPGGNVKLSSGDAEVIAASVILYQSLIKAATQMKLAVGHLDSNQLEASLNELLAMEVNNENISKIVISLKEAVEAAISGDISEQNQLQMQTHILQFISLYQQLA